MKPTHILIALAAIVYAAPAVEQTMPPPLAELDTHFQPHIKRCDKKGPPPDYGRHPYDNRIYNQLTDGTPCRNVTLIFARGMGAKGNVGKVNGTGPIIFNRLATIIGKQNLAIEGVKYKADMGSVLKKGPRPGGRVMSELINRAATRCPNTQIVLVGHSAGGALVHQSAENITAEVTARIAAG
ncbi:cutinase [Fusarium mundagurra]|uniref:cutinase n=1 Tax=Fusarium mundagurra TaxID=1567541 RepID=A0A8H6DN80_9HYPO|nr:cutinase [Fusarium mundagurra]